MKRRVLFGLVMVGLLSSAVAEGAGLETPIAASPGSPHQVSLIEDRCPAFIWAQVEGARAYELAVYRIGAEGRSPEPVLRRTFPGSVHAWTPALGRCLEPGVRYAWTLRAVGPEGPSEWSPPAFLRVAGGPVEPPARPPVAGPLTPEPLSLEEFIVDSGGNVQAASFTGSPLSDFRACLCDLYARTDLPFPTALSCDCSNISEKCVLDEHCCAALACVGEACCVPLGSSCSVPADCCGSLLCGSGECCVGLGDPCSVPADCCIPLSCSLGGSCCKLPGQTCSQNSECCNNTCQWGLCTLL